MKLKTKAIRLTRKALYWPLSPLHQVLEYLPIGPVRRLALLRYACAAVYYVDTPLRSSLSAEGRSA